MRISQEFSSKQYSSEEDLEGDNHHFQVETFLKLDSAGKVFDISTHEHHPGESTATQSFGGTVVFSDWSALQEVAALLKQYLREQDERTRSVTIPLESGTGFNSRLGQFIEDIEEATFSVDATGLEVYAQGHRGEIQHYRKLVDHTQQDRQNTIELLDIVDELFQSRDEEPVLDVKHPDLRNDAVPEYIDGHYQSSVRTAFRVLEQRIREEGDFPQDSVGMGMAQDAFSPDDGPLTFADVGAEQRGWMFLYAGGFGALRNPPSHRNEDSIDQHRAMETLHFVDLLLNVLESQTLNED